MVDGVHDLDARELTLDGRGDRNSVHLVAREPEPRRPAPRKDHAEHPCRAERVPPGPDLRGQRQRRPFQIVPQRGCKPLDVGARKRIGNVIRILDPTAAEAIELFVHIGRR